MLYYVHRTEWRESMDDKKIADLVAMLDQFMSGGGGHLNVTNNSTDAGDTTKKVTTMGSLECAGNMACQVPTLHVGIDDDEEA